MNVLGWVLLTIVAGAPDHWLQLQHCPALDARALRELVGLELSSSIGSRTATVRCEAEVFWVTVRTGGSDRVRRVLRTAVGDVPERYLAVEIAELVETSEEPVPAQVGETALAPTVASKPPQFTPWGWLVAGGRVELVGRPITPVAGASVVVGGRLWRPLSVRAELAGGGGGRGIGTDGVRLGFLSGALAALATFDVGRVVVHAGAGARVGEVWMRGVAEQSGVTGLDHRGTTWSPFVSIGTLGAVGRRGVLSAHLDAGWTPRAVRGFSGTALVFTSGGPWLGVSFSGGIGLGSVSRSAVPRVTPLKRG